ncbi:MAG: stage V sporulation protein S [Armatimonadetes bacterium]|nr:stage V sporulation protein S [Armatimonadota bacterium]
MELLKVSSGSNPSSVAGAVASLMRKQGRAEIQAIGAAAINQAVKALAIARGFLAPSGVDIGFVPAFSEVQIDGETRTTIRFVVEPRRPK